MRSAGSKAKNSAEGDKEDDSRPPPFVPYKVPSTVSWSNTQLDVISRSFHVDLS